MAIYKIRARIEGPEVKAVGCWKLTSKKTRIPLGEVTPSGTYGSWAYKRPMIVDVRVEAEGMFAAWKIVREIITTYMAQNDNPIPPRKRWGAKVQGRTA